MLPLVFPLLKASSAVRALLGQGTSGDPLRAYRHGEAPQNVAKPYLTWVAIGADVQNTLSETPAMDLIPVQLDCWDTDDTRVETLARAVRDALEPHAHMTGLPLDDKEATTLLYRMSLQFDFWVSR